MKCKTMEGSIFSSKINWLGLCFIVLGALIDPKFYDQLNALGFALPEWFVAELIRWMGFILIIIRSFMTTANNIQPGPDSPPDVYVGKVDMTPIEKDIHCTNHVWDTNSWHCKKCGVSKERAYNGPFVGPQV